MVLIYRVGRVTHVTCQFNDTHIMHYIARIPPCHNLSNVGILLPNASIYLLLELIYGFSLNVISPL